MLAMLLIFRFEVPLKIGNILLDASDQRSHLALEFGSKAKLEFVDVHNNISLKCSWLEWISAR